MNTQNMTRKTKFMILGFLLLVTLSVFLDDFWSCTACVLGKALASAVVVLLLVITKVLAGIAGMHFLL